MDGNKHLAIIRKYYDGCNRGDIEQMMSTFEPDVVHYFVEEPPVRGAAELAKKWADFKMEAEMVHWSVDHEIAIGDEAVIEWTLVYKRPGLTPPTIIVRGSEWYFFKNGRIAEIRAYYNTHKRELMEFPCAARGYPLLQDSS